MKKQFETGITKKEKLVSVIVPVYNVEEYLAECINSIINQTYKNLEIILIDDGSTDGSGKICDAYKKMDDRIIVIHKDNGGLSDARNVGMEVMTGSYVTFVDSDDYIEDDMITILVDLAENNNVLISSVRWKAIGEKLDYTVPDANGKIEIVNDEDFIMTVTEGIGCKERFATIAVWGRLYDRSLVINEKFPVGIKYEDIVFTTKVFTKAKKIAYENTDKYCYRIRANSITYKETVNISDSYIYDRTRQMYSQIVYLKEIGYVGLMKKLMILHYLSLFRDYVIFFNRKMEKEQKYIRAEMEKYKLSVVDIIKYGTYNKRKINAILKMKCAPIMCFLLRGKYR